MAESAKRIGKRRSRTRRPSRLVVEGPGSNVMILDAIPCRTVEEVRHEVSRKLKAEIGGAHLTFDGHVLRGSGEMRGCGICDGSVSTCVQRAHLTALLQHAHVPFFCARLWLKAEREWRLNAGVFKNSSHLHGHILLSPRTSIPSPCTSPSTSTFS